MTINATNRNLNIRASGDGRFYSKYPNGFDTGYVGGILTLAGSFPSKPIAAPFYYDNFETRTAGAIATAIGFSDLGGDGRGTCIVSTTRSYNGSKSLCMDYPTGYNSVFPKLGIIGLSTTEVYISCNMYWERYTTGADPGSSLIFKLCRAGANPVYTGIPRMYETIRPNYTTGIIGASDKGFVTSSGSTSFNGSDGNANRDQWNRLEYRYRLSTPGVSDGVFQTWTNLSFVEGSDTAMTRAGGDSGVIQEVMSVFDGMDGKGTDNAYRMYLDDFYIDTTCIRVEVGDASTLAACTVRVLAVPTAWSTTSITANLDTTALGSGTRYVYVFDENNEVYGSPVEVSI